MRTAPPFRMVAALVLVIGLVAGCQTMTGRSAGRYIDDRTITASVKTKLVADRLSNMSRVSVKTVNGTVYLGGVVDPLPEQERAAVLASLAIGVRDIVNNLLLSSLPAAAPKWRRRRDGRCTIGGREHREFAQQWSAPRLLRRTDSARQEASVSTPPSASSARAEVRQVAPKLIDLSETVLYGDVWERPGLSKRDRSLVTVAALIAMYRGDQLPVHLERALANGVTREEIGEVITHLAFYAGWPAAMTAGRVARQVFDKQR